MAQNPIVWIIGLLLLVGVGAFIFAVIVATMRDLRRVASLYLRVPEKIIKWACLGLIEISLGITPVVVAIFVPDLLPPMVGFAAVGHGLILHLILRDRQNTTLEEEA